MIAELEILPPVSAKVCTVCQGQGNVWLQCPTCKGAGGNCRICAGMGRMWVRCAACRGSGTS